MQFHEMESNQEQEIQRAISDGRQWMSVKMQERSEPNHSPRDLLPFPK